MATTQQIFDQAVQRSNLNDPDLIPEAQWLDYITSLERRVFLVAAAGNPDLFGKEAVTAARSASTDTWNLDTTPGNIAAVSLVEVSAITGTVTGVSVGDQVFVVSIRDVDAALAPRTYLRFKIMTEYNSELQDDSSNFVTTLKIYYSHLPSDRTATSDSLDLPEEYNNLVVVPLAALMALRDQRPEEAAVLNQEFATDWLTFLQLVGVTDEVTVRELDSVQASAPGVGTGV